MAETSLHLAFKILQDPRMERQKKHELLDIVILSVLAVLCGAESYNEIADYGKANIAFLKQILSLKNEIPSHDTINRVFQALNFTEFEKCFIAWAQGLKKTGEIERVIAIDGKTLRGSKDSFHHKSPIHSVNAWSVENGLCLGQMQCDEKTNEITTIPALLKLLDIKGSIITIDAMGTQTKIAEQIIESDADYILAVKGNQKELEEDVMITIKRRNAVVDTSTVEKGHGRIETRKCEVFNKGYVDDKKWMGVKSVIKITSIREVADKTETNERYYISSLEANSNDFNTLIRSHWAVENNLHWVLDMVFREDDQRKRANHAAKNFAIVRKMALNILKKDTSSGSLRGKRLRAGWNQDFLINLIKI
jgi:predicted transposase YbfD/YdcC